MVYEISQSEAERLGALLVGYYDEAFEKGIRNLMDRMVSNSARPDWLVIYSLEDAYTSLKQKSKDSFFTTFRADVKRELNVYFANKFDVVSDLLGIAEQALDAAVKKLTDMISLPILPTVVEKGYNFLKSKTLGKAQDEAYKASIATAGQQVAAASGGKDPSTLFNNDKDVADAAKEAVTHFKQIGKFVSTLPTKVMSFDDAITFPRAVFKLRAEASNLTVSLQTVRTYLAWMDERFVEVNVATERYKKQVKNNMAEAVKEVLNAAYEKGNSKGADHVQAGKYKGGSEPKRPALDQTKGGATQLAVYVAHATAFGYYQAGNKVLSNPAIKTVAAGGFNFSKK